MAKKEEQIQTGQAEIITFSKKKFWKTIIIAGVILLIIGYMFVTYSSNQKIKYYVKGGQEAITHLTELIEKDGGVTIQKDSNTTITLTKYHKLTA